MIEQTLHTHTQTQTQSEERWKSDANSNDKKGHAAEVGELS